MEKLKGLQKVVLETDEAREVMRAYERLASDIEAYERSRVEEWGQLVSEISEQKLKQPLLRSVLQLLHNCFGLSLLPKGVLTGWSDLQDACLGGYGPCH